MEISQVMKTFLQWQNVTAQLVIAAHVGDAQVALVNVPVVRVTLMLMAMSNGRPFSFCSCL